MGQVYLQINLHRIVIIIIMIGWLPCPGNIVSKNCGTVQHYFQVQLWLQTTVGTSYRAGHMAAASPVFYPLAEPAKTDL